jgi:hypothetical protein
MSLMQGVNEMGMNFVDTIFLLNKKYDTSGFQWIVIPLFLNPERSSSQSGECQSVLDLSSRT